jgi:hypothetical protein
VARRGSTLLVSIYPHQMVMVEVTERNTLNIINAFATSSNFYRQGHLVRTDLCFLAALARNAYMSSLLGLQCNGVVCGGNAYFPDGDLATVVQFDDRPRDTVQQGALCTGPKFFPGHSVPPYAWIFVLLFGLRCCCLPG